jgi:Castor and Pollux, part of voltage-gated ion channel
MFLVQAALELHPELTGCTFQEVHFRFSHAIALGVFSGEKMKLCPPVGYILRPDDEILLLRTTGSMQQDALPEPLTAAPDTWVPQMTAHEFAMVCIRT